MMRVKSLAPPTAGSGGVLRAGTAAKSVLGGWPTLVAGDADCIRSTWLIGDCRSP